MNATLDEAVQRFQARDWPGAREHCERILAGAPLDSDAGELLALIALEQRRPQEALRCLRRCLEIDPKRADVHANLGALLLETGSPREALESCDRAIALQPDHAEAHANRGVVLRELDRPAEALVSCDRAIALRGGFAEAFVSRGQALVDLQRFEEALKSCDTALALQPQLRSAHTNRALVLQNMGLGSQALESFRYALTLDSGDVEANWGQALLQLQRGEFESGWDLYEWRKRLSRPMGLRELPQPEWTGQQPLQGKSLYIHSEQGLGDTLQFCRYAHLAQQRGARVILAVWPQLRDLIRTLSASIEVISTTEVAPPTDYQAALMSLPRAFATRLENVPAGVPYLSADPARVQYWQERLGSHGFKIGICWQGRAAKVDAGRSLPLSTFEALSTLPDVRLISLQKYHGAEQLQSAPGQMRVETLGPEFDTGPDAFLDSAAIMQSLDLIVTSDTAIAHLAGALARPTWVALKRVPDWRWLLERDDSPWYPTMRLFRQSQSGEWQDVILRMRDELTRLTPR